MTGLEDAAAAVTILAFLTGALRSAWQLALTTHELAGTVRRLSGMLDRLDARVTRLERRPPR